jgi:uncharacterized protein (DUF305 family)
MSFLQPKGQINVKLLVAGAIAFSALAFTACSSKPQATAQMPDGTTEHSSPMPTDGSMAGMDHSMEMDLGPADADYDLRFIDAMIPHHEGAIAMAEEALEKSQRPEIQTLAQAIIAAQDREINELMRTWRSTWYPNAPTTAMAWHSEMGHMMPMTTEQQSSMMMNVDLGVADDEFDLRFINAMIPHHEGAIVMARDALRKSQRPEIQQLANDIIASQQAEIDQMTEWRSAWYNQ